MDSLVSADLVRLFVEELRLCKVQVGETVLVFTDPAFPHPTYAPAAFAAAKVLGAAPYILLASSEDSFTSQLCRLAWQSAGLVLGMSTVPRGELARRSAPDRDRVAGFDSWEAGSR